MLLKARGQPCDTLRGIALAGTAEVAKGRRFLRGKPERANLYGAVMALDAPNGPARALFDWSEGNPKLRLWNMEMLAQLWFAGAAPTPGTAVLLDEGIVHRLAVSALLAGRGEKAAARLVEAPPSHGVAILSSTPALAMARCAARPRGVPAGFADADGSADSVRFAAFSDILSQCETALTDSDVPVLNLDADRSVAELAIALANWIAATIPAESTPG